MYSEASRSATENPSNSRRNGNCQTAYRSDRGLRSETFHHRKGLGRRGAKGIDGCQWTSTKRPCGRFGGARVSCPWSSKKSENSTGKSWKSLANAFTFLPQFSFKDLPTWKYT